MQGGPLCMEHLLFDLMVQEFSDIAVPMLLLVDGPLWPLHISPMKRKTEKRACRESGTWVFLSIGFLSTIVAYPVLPV